MERKRLVLRRVLKPAPTPPPIVIDSMSQVAARSPAEIPAAGWPPGVTERQSTYIPYTVAGRLAMQTQGEEAARIADGDCDTDWEFFATFASLELREPFRMYDTATGWSQVYRKTGDMMRFHALPEMNFMARTGREVAGSIERSISYTELRGNQEVRVSRETAYRLYRRNTRRAPYADD